MGVNETTLQSFTIHKGNQYRSKNGLHHRASYKGSPNISSVKPIKRVKQYSNLYEKNERHL